MSTITRGVRNAFRNTIRTGGVTVILALSVGLAIVMLLSLKAVQGRIKSIQASIGNTITVSPAGARGFEGGGEPLTQSQIDSLKSVANVSKVDATLNDRLTPTTDTSLASAIDAGTLGRRFRVSTDGGRTTQTNEPSGSSSSGATPAFSLPITVTGATELNATVANGSQFKVTSGDTIDATKDANIAMIGSELATKNSLKVGSTFTYKGTTVTVKGIYDAGNKFANAGLIMPLSTVQRLSDQAGDVTSATVTVNSIENVASTTNAIKTKLGDTADVVNQQDSSASAIEPLKNIQSIALYSLIGSLVAGSIIIFLTMLMIVRERRREIGVLKAIGASNVSIVGQFVSESLTLTAMGAVVGVVGGVLLSNPILKLMASSASSSSSATNGMMGGGGRMMMRFEGGPGGALRGIGNTVNNLHATLGYEVLLYGLGAAVVIAVIGSALPAWTIAKIRPAEVMRGE